MTASWMKLSVRLSMQASGRGPLLGRYFPSWTAHGRCRQYYRWACVPKSFAKASHHTVLSPALPYKSAVGQGPSGLGDETAISMHTARGPISALAAPKMNDLTGTEPQVIQDAANKTQEPRESARAMVDKSNMFDAAYIRNHLPYPSHDQYPNASVNLRHRETGNRLHKLFSPWIANAEYIIRGKPHAPIRRCMLTAKVPNVGLREAVGEGLGKLSSRACAWVHLISVLHLNDELQRVFPNTSIDHMSQSESQTKATNAAFEVYNYIASFGLVPVYNACMSISKHPNVQVSITLPEWGIEASAVGLNLAVVETDACLDFKAQAEAYQRCNNISAHDFSVSTINARHFVRTYKRDHPLTKFDVKFKVHDLNKQSRWQGQMLINGRRIRQSTPRSTRQQAKDMMYLTTAMHLIAQDPSLLPSFAQSFVQHSDTDTFVASPCAETVGSVSEKGPLSEISSTKSHVISTTVMPVEQELITPIQQESTTPVEQEPRTPTQEEPITPIQQELINPVYSEPNTITNAIPPILTPIEKDLEDVMRKSLVELQMAGLPDFKEVPVAAAFGEPHFAPKRRLEGRAAQDRNKELAVRLKNIDKNRSTDIELPITAYRKEIVEMVSSNIYSIVVGSTGSGKTTVVPQLLLDDAIAAGNGAGCNIICTQPRRIAATSVARRVAAERGELLQNTVGYQVRFNSKPPKTGGSILYCTTGILLEQLKHSPEETIKNLTHIIIDEVHERDKTLDFLLISLKLIMQARRAAGKAVPRVVFMSATLDIELFANYFGETRGLQTIPCPSINVPGRLFPVKEIHLEEILQEMRLAHPKEMGKLLDAEASNTVQYLQSERALAPTTNQSVDQSSACGSQAEAERVLAERQENFVPVSLLAATIGHICGADLKSGAILAFLPGIDEIQKTHDILLQPSFYGCDFGDSTKFKIHTLHSSITREAQEEVFKPLPEGCRRIILSTTIAETSVTIPDVRFVIDTGKLRESRYDQARGITRLQTVWISKSNIRQRAGRAGRVQEGNYYALFSKERRSILKATGVPELLRSDLQETCLAVKSQQYTELVQDFLTQAIEPPSPEAVNSAVSDLKAIEAFTTDEQLTDLGRLLSRMPVRPSLGKMVVLGIIFRCLDPMLLLSAAFAERSIFARPIGQRAEANESRKSFSGHGSDHIAFLHAFNEMRHVQDTCGSQALWQHGIAKFLHVGAFTSILKSAQQIEHVLVRAGLVPAPEPGHLGGTELNTNSTNINLIRALLVAGHPSQLACKTKGTRVFQTSKETKVYVHPSSLSRIRNGPGHPPGALFSFGALSKSLDGRALFFRDCTRVSPLPVLLFGGSLRLEGNVLTVDGWLPLEVASGDNIQTAKILLEFRKALDRVLGIAFRSLTRRQADNTQPYLADIPMVEKLARSVAELLVYEDDWRLAATSE